MSKAATKSATHLRLINGRLVSPSLADPEVKTQVVKKAAALRKDVVALRASYVRDGILNKDGTLSKRYGGV